MQPITPNVPEMRPQMPQMPAQHSSKNTIQNMAASLFVFCVVILSAISVLGVWDYFNSDVIWKSFQTLGIIALVSIVVMVASKFVGDPEDPMAPKMQNPEFRLIRNITMGTLIASSVLLAFLGVLTIWEVIADKQVLGKSLASLAIVGFSSLIIVLVCLERENNPLWEKRGGEVTFGGIVAAVIFMWIMAAFMF